MSALLSTAIEAARAAAEALRQARSRPLNVHWKGFRDIVTDADLAAERAILDVIRTAYPDHNVLSEEDATPKQDAWTPPPGALWIIDPLDGTTNFARGVPSYCTSVAVAFDGVLQAGAIFDPARDTLFAAARGEGFTINGEPAHVSEESDLALAVGACDWPRDRKTRARAVAIAERMLIHARTVRAQGSAALNLAYVAAGWYDFYFHPDLSPWDLAAGALMVQEAGGALTTLEGAPFDMSARSLLISNGRLHEAAFGQVRAALAL
jgi:myo-inositol-1(or 4)-monophosphatase